MLLSCIWAGFIAGYGALIAMNIYKRVPLFVLCNLNRPSIPTKIKVRTKASLLPSPPVNFPKSKYVLINPENKIEEETLPYYNSERYYPVRIGQVFTSRYQVTTKLGYGVNSTVWLCRDLK